MFGINAEVFAKLYVNGKTISYCENRQKKKPISII